MDAIRPTPPKMPPAMPPAPAAAAPAVVVAPLPNAVPTDARPPLIFVPSPASQAQRPVFAVLFPVFPVLVLFPGISTSGAASAASLTDFPFMYTTAALTTIFATVVRPVSVFFLLLNRLPTIFPILSATGASFNAPNARLIPLIVEITLSLFSNIQSTPLWIFGSHSSIFSPSFLTPLLARSPKVSANRSSAGML